MDKEARYLRNPYESESSSSNTLGIYQDFSENLLPCSGIF